MYAESPKRCQNIQQVTKSHRKCQFCNQATLSCSVSQKNDPQLTKEFLILANKGRTFFLLSFVLWCHDKVKRCWSISRNHVLYLHFIISWPLVDVNWLKIAIWIHVNTVGALLAKAITRFTFDICLKHVSSSYLWQRRQGKFYERILWNGKEFFQFGRHGANLLL